MMKTTELPVIGVSMTGTAGDLLTERATVKGIVGDTAGFGMRKE